MKDKLMMLAIIVIMHIISDRGHFSKEGRQGALVGQLGSQDWGVVETWELSIMENWRRGVGAWWVGARGDVATPSSAPACPSFSLIYKILQYILKLHKYELVQRQCKRR